MSGSGHTSLFVLEAERLTTTGELRFFERRAESGNTVRNGFCPSCGSPVLSVNSGFPDARYVHAATLDDPGRFVPSQVVWASEQQPWDAFDPGLE